VRKGVPYRFNFLNLYKSDSLYNHGLLPLIYSTTNAANGVGWVRSGTQGKAQPPLTPSLPCIMLIFSVLLQQRHTALSQEQEKCANGQAASVLLYADLHSGVSARQWYSVRCCADSFIAGFI
jgi:hypothetical protein